MGRQNKTKCKTEELKSNINKTAFNIYFSSNFVFFVSSARTSCSIVLIFSLTWSHFILSPFPLNTNLKSYFFSASSMHCFYLLTITETTLWLVFSFCFKVLMSEVICLPFSLSFFLFCFLVHIIKIGYITLTCTLNTLTVGLVIWVVCGSKLFANEWFLTSLFAIAPSDDMSIFKSSPHGSLLMAHSQNKFDNKVQLFTVKHIILFQTYCHWVWHVLVLLIKCREVSKYLVTLSCTANVQGHKVF